MAVLAGLDPPPGRLQADTHERTPTTRTSLALLLVLVCTQALEAETLRV